MSRQTLRPLVRKHFDYHKANVVKAKEAVKSDFKALTPLHVLEMIVVLIVALQLTIFFINFFRPQYPILGLRLEGKTIGATVGGDTRNAVTTIVTERQNELLNIEVGGIKSTISLSQLGEKADVDQVYSKVLSAGRAGGIFSQIIDQNRALVGQNNLTLNHPGFDMTLAQNYITSLDEQTDIQPTNATFVRKDTVVTIQAEKPGRVIDSDAAIEAIRAADVNKNTPITLPTIVVDASVTNALLSPLLPHVQEVASESLIITAVGHSVTLSPDQLVAAIVPKIVHTDGQPAVAELTYNVQQLNAAIDSVVQAATVQPQATLMNGSTVIRTGTKGLHVKDDQSIIRVLAALLKRQTGAGNPSTVDIPMIAVDPPVVQQGPSPGSTTGSGVVRLTFDDGPCAHTAQVLSILQQYHIRATFYLIGRNVNSCPGQVAAIAAAGQKIGNHSYTHSNLTTLSYAGVVNEIESTQDAIRHAAGVIPLNFRPPYGAVNSTVRQAAGAENVSVDLWSVDPQDWAQPGSSVIISRVLSKAQPGSVILLHVLYQQTVDALPAIITGLRARGLTIE